MTLMEAFQQARRRLRNPYWLPTWIFGLAWAWTLFMPADGWWLPASAWAWLGWIALRRLAARYGRAQL